jgi:hypothetical protein
MRAGATYVNVHTAQYPDGEIRGQIGEDVEATPLGAGTGGRGATGL